MWAPLRRQGGGRTLRGFPSKFCFPAGTGHSQSSQMGTLATVSSAVNIQGR